MNCIISKALQYMQQYFSKQTDSGFVTKDFETMGDIYDKLAGKQDSAARYYTLACSMEKDSTLRIPYYKKLCDIYKAEKNYPEQANWLGKYYQHNARATNLDLFNWGLANYMAQDYKMADSVFGMYESKYPEQSFGYYWRARSNAAIDTSMLTGIAIPHYTKFVEMTEKDTANAVNRRHLIESYGYLAAYKANTEKNYAEAIAWFEKLLSLDPGNKDAQRYIDILKKNMGSNNMNRAGAQRRP
jgi:tetratricopeptide (TPR) repeat protein